MLTDEIIGALSPSGHIDVISRLSSRLLRQRGLNLAHISSHLGVDYVLAGRCQEVGRPELMVELTETLSGAIRWSRTCRLSSSTPAEVRELSGWLGSEVMAAILLSECQRATLSPLASLESYTLLFAAITLMDRWTRASFERSKKLLDVLRERPLASAAQRLALGMAYQVHQSGVDQRPDGRWPPGP